MLPSEYNEIREQPNLRQMLEEQVDPQFVDLRTLLVPRQDWEAGFNFTSLQPLFYSIFSRVVRWCSINQVKKTF